MKNINLSVEVILLLTDFPPISRTRGNDNKLFKFVSICNIIIFFPRQTPNSVNTCLVSKNFDFLCICQFASVTEAILTGFGGKKTRTNTL